MEDSFKRQQQDKDTKDKQLVSIPKQNQLKTARLHLQKLLQILSFTDIQTLHSSCPPPYFRSRSRYFPLGKGTSILDQLFSACSFVGHSLEIHSFNPFNLPRDLAVVHRSASPPGLGT